MHEGRRLTTNAFVVDRLQNPTTGACGPFLPREIIVLIAIGQFSCVPAFLSGKPTHARDCPRTFMGKTAASDRWGFFQRPARRLSGNPVRGVVERVASCWCRLRVDRIGGYLDFESTPTGREQAGDVRTGFSDSLLVGWVVWMTRGA